MNLARGWGWPLNATKAHYFLEAKSTALCGKWIYTGERQDDKHESQDNCAECRKRRAKLEAPATTACDFCGRDRLDPTWKHKGDTVRVGEGGIAKTCFLLREHTHPPRETDCFKEKT